MFGMNSIVGKKYFKDAPKDSLLVTSRFFTIQGEGIYRGMPSYFVRLAKCNLACSFCFVGNTEIAMSNKPRKKIKDVVVGDVVVAYDETTGTFEPGTVSRLYQSQTDELVYIRTATDRIYCTPEHPFYVRGKGWIKAIDLQPSDVLLQAEFIHNGEMVHTVERIVKGSAAWVQLAGSKDAACTVYNFEVDKYHSYVANGKVVHNCDTYFDSGEYQTYDQIFADCDKEIEAFYARRNMKVPAWAKHCDGYWEPTGIDNAIGTPPEEWVAESKRKVVLVITGGEPTLQTNLTEFLERANKIFFHTQIESNGTDPLTLPDATTLVCSPKCLEKKQGMQKIPVTAYFSGNDERGEGMSGRPSYVTYHEEPRYVAVRYLEPKKEMLERADCLKFVMCAPDDDQSQFTPYSEVPQWAHDWAANTGKPVFVSPMNIYLQEPQKAKNLRAQKQSGEITIEERSTVDEVISWWENDLLDMKKNHRNHEYAAEYCMRHGFIFQVQLHLFASLA